ncbi:hypothetical protein BC831DRAFT_441545 [Entophlyctis helioformis]|nr:hypothetical protein BC831DRAFT_441545 [Entophlyctis helioformis]
MATAATAALQGSMAALSAADGTTSISDVLAQALALQAEHQPADADGSIDRVALSAVEACLSSQAKQQQQQQPWLQPQDMERCWQILVSALANAQRLQAMQGTAGQQQGGRSQHIPPATANVFQLLVARCTAAMAAGDGRPMQDQDVSVTLKYTLAICELAHTQPDFVLLDQGWKAAGAFVHAVRNQHSALQSCCIQILQQLRHGASILQDSPAASCSALAKFYLWQLLNLLLKPFPSLCTQPQALQLVMDTVTELCVSVAQDRVLGSKDADKVLFSGASAIMACLVGPAAAPTTAAQVVVLDAIMLPLPTSASTPQQALLLSSALRQAGSAVLAHPLTPSSQHRTDRVYGSAVLRGLFRILDSADPRLVALAKDGSASMFSEILASLCVLLQDMDPGIWPDIEQVLWEWLLQSALPTTWLMVVDLFGYISRHAPQSITEPYAATVIPAMLARLPQGSSLVPRMQTLMKRIAPAGHTPWDMDLLLPATLSIDTLSNAGLVALLRRWETMPRWSPSDVDAMLATDSDLDTTLTRLVVSLGRLWRHLCEQLDAENDVGRAVEQFQRLHLALTPLASLMAFTDMDRRTCSKVAKTCAALETLRRDMLGPVVVYFSAASGAVEFARSLNDPTRAASLMVARTCTSLAIESILAVYVSWTHELPADLVPYPPIMEFVQKIAHLKLASLNPISQLLDAALNATCWTAVHLGCETAVFVASVSPSIVPLMSPASRSFIKAWLAKSPAKGPFVRIPWTSTDRPQTLATRQPMMLKDILHQPVQHRMSRSDSDPNGSHMAASPSSLVDALLAVQSHLNLVHAGNTSQGHAAMRSTDFTDQERALMHETLGMLHTTLFEQ